VFGLTSGPLEAALFDLDGLLVDSEPLWHEAEVLVLNQYGVPLTPEMCRQTKGRYVTEAVLHWHARYPWDSPVIEEVVTEILDKLAFLVDTRLQLKAGALKAVEACAGRGLKLAVASSSPLRIIAAALARFDLQGQFEVVCSAENEKSGKPDPAVFFTAARLLGHVDPARCVVFEDSPAGIRAAKTAGMLCVAVPEERAGLPAAAMAPVTTAVVRAATVADVVLSSLEELDDRAWRRLEIPAGAGVRVTAEHRGSKRTPIRVAPGDVLTLGERDDEWPAFVLVTKSDGSQGWVPSRILTRTGSRSSDLFTARPQFTYDTTELDVDPGAELQVVEPDLGSGWLWCRSGSGTEGWVPLSCVEPNDP
jgi:mannitol-1-/sugar-/sorbitol-6-/2-deoxyglucose-6-phosphatase